jgi:hypothetical protein
MFENKCWQIHLNSKNYVARTYLGVGYLFIIISKVKKYPPPPGHFYLKSLSDGVKNV